MHIQGLAFVASELITFDAMTTYGLQAEWLAALLQVMQVTLLRSRQVVSST